MNIKYRLPNDVEDKADGNRVGEYDEYVRLYKKPDRTNAGYTFFESAISGKKYETTQDGGEEELLAILYEEVRNYIIDVEWANDIYNTVSNVPHSVNIPSSNINYIAPTTTSEGAYVAGIIEVTEVPASFPESGVVFVQFYAPADVRKGDRLEIGSQFYTILTMNLEEIPGGAWSNGSFVQLAVPIGSGNAYLNGYSTQISYSSEKGTPPQNASDEVKKHLWIDENTNIAWYWNKTANTWKPIAGTFAPITTA